MLCFLSRLEPRFPPRGNPAPPRPAWARTLSCSCPAPQGAPPHPLQVPTPCSGPPSSMDTLLAPTQARHAVPSPPPSWTPSSSCLTSRTCPGWTSSPLAQRRGFDTMHRAALLLMLSLPALDSNTEPSHCDALLTTTRNSNHLRCATSASHPCPRQTLSLLHLTAFVWNGSEGERKR